MADKNVKNTTISLKALVDMGNNKVIYAEFEEALLDILFSFLTMPLGNIIKLTCNQSPAVDIGCTNNLFQSVANFDVQRLRTAACKTMLLHPRNAAETHCKSLKLKFDYGEPTRYFLCSSSDCTLYNFKLLSHYKDVQCSCGQTMSREMNLTPIAPKKVISAVRDGGVFVKGLTRLLITDELQVLQPSTAASLSLLSKLGVVDGSTIEERSFDVGVDEVLNLLKCSLISKTPLTETLLKHKPAVPQLSKKEQVLNLLKCSFIFKTPLTETLLKHIPVPQLSKKEIKLGSSIQYNLVGKISIKIMVSISKKMVCYAEAGEDFVDLLFSFLTLPLGYIAKKMQGSSSSKGCMHNLYSVHDLDAVHYLKSDEHKAMLVSPKLPPGFGYENQPLDIDEASHPSYYYAYSYDYANSDRILTTYETKDHYGNPAAAEILTVMDPKSHLEETRNGGGFVDGPTMFTVTDNLVVTPMSPFSGLSVLKKLKVPFNDIEEHVVRVGKEEASRLLLASFVSESALTNAFIRWEPKQEQ